MEQTSPAVGAPLDAPVRPRAWAWRDEPSGIEVYSGWDEPRPTSGSEPLYDQAAIDAAVAAERERLRATIADDAYAVTFQSMGQYRSALLRALGPNARVQPP